MANLQLAIPFLKRAEGGLSRSTTDSASAHPAPWPYMGKSGWHTNKGVTYATFSSLAPKLGYSNTAENFFSMPNTIWDKIYKNEYWDKMQADNINSNRIALAIVDYAFNSGAAGALKQLKRFLLVNYNIPTCSIAEMVAAFNKITASGDTDVFNKLLASRKVYYASLKQPANEAGWFKRIDDLKSFGESLVNSVSSTVKNNTGTILFFLAYQPLHFIIENLLHVKQGLF